MGSEYAHEEARQVHEGDPVEPPAWPYLLVELEMFCVEARSGILKKPHHEGGTRRSKEGRDAGTLDVLVSTIRVLPCLFRVVAVRGAGGVFKPARSIGDVFMC